MERKTLFIFLTVMIVVVGVGIYILLIDDNGGAHENDGPGIVDITQPEDGVTTDLEKQKSEESQKELLAPEQNLMASEEEMAPQAFREALGGYKGRLIDSDGTPVPDTLVELLGAKFLDIIVDAQDLMNDKPVEYDYIFASDKTKEDGRFLLSGVFARSFYVILADSGGPRVQLRILDTIPSPGEVVDLGDIVLDPCMTLVGKVVDEMGDPAKGVRIRATDLPQIVFISGIQDYQVGGSFLVGGGGYLDNAVIDPIPVINRLYKKLPIPETASKEDGTFRLEGVPLGKVIVLVNHPGYKTIQKGPLSTKKGGEKDLGVIELSRGMTARGRVVDINDKPIPGAEVRLGSTYTVKEFVVLQPSVVTDERGAFSQSGLATSKTMVAVRRHMNDAWKIEGPFNPAGDSIKITLKPTYDLKITVSDTNGKSVNGASIKMSHKGIADSLLLISPPKKIGIEKIERPGDGIIVVKGLSQGRYTVLLQAPGFAIIEFPATIRDNPIDKEVQLQPAMSVKVNVVDSITQSPVEWATVYSCVNNEDFFSKPTRFSRDRTDENGMALLKNVGEGKFMINVSHPKYAVYSNKVTLPAEEEIVVELIQGGTIEGVVYSGGTGIEPPYMLMMNVRRWQGGPEGETPCFRATDLEGKFRVSNLTPGEWRIYDSHRLFNKKPVDMINNPNDISDVFTRSNAVVKSGETSFVEIELGQKVTGPCGSISGTVYIDNAPVEGVSLSLWASTNFKVITDAAGHFNFAKIPVGSHSISLSNVEGLNMRLSRQVHVEHNVPLYEDFNILTGAISGRIVAEDGSNVEGVHRINLNMHDTTAASYSVRHNAESNKDGAFLFEKVPIGVYVISSRSKDFTSIPVTGVKVRPGVETGPVIIKRKTPTLVSGKVVLTDKMYESRWLMLLFAPQEGTPGNGAYLQISKKTGEFKTMELIPGSYIVSYYYEDGTSAKSFELSVPEGGVTGLVLVPEED